MAFAGLLAGECRCTTGTEEEGQWWHYSQLLILLQVMSSSKIIILNRLQDMILMGIFLSGYDTSGVLDNSAKKSLRNDNAFDKSNLNSRTPLAYEHLRWDDALYAEKVWRELDLREKMNQVFRYETQDDNGSQIFINMLLKAVNKGEVTAFADDRFTTPLTIAEIQQITPGRS